MVSKIIPIVLVSLCMSGPLFSQSADSLASQILQLEQRVSAIELNLASSKSKFQSSILIATAGYATTIAGGLMLGRENDELGQRLLILGGITGTIGTYKMIDAFSYLTGKRRKKAKKKE